MPGQNHDEISSTAGVTKVIEVASSNQHSPLCIAPTLKDVAAECLARFYANDNELHFLHLDLTERNGVSLLLSYSLRRRYQSSPQPPPLCLFHAQPHSGSQRRIFPTSMLMLRLISSSEEGVT